MANNTNSQVNKEDKQKHILGYLARRIFKPLTTLFLRNAIPYKIASNWLKQSYVEVAQSNDEFALNGKRQTKSRIAVITGITRVEVDKLIKNQNPNSMFDQNWNRASRVLSGWKNDADYIDDKGEPRIISIKGDQSFETLVENYSGGTTLRSVLDDLISIGSVEKVDDKLRVVRKEYIYQANKDKLASLENVGMSAGDLLNTLVVNDRMDDIEKRRIQRTIIQRNVPTSVAPYIEKYIKSHVSDFLYELDKDLSQKLNAFEEENDSKLINRLGIGVYYYED
jgi:hypothetical protein